MFKFISSIFGSGQGEQVRSISSYVLLGLGGFALYYYFYLTPKHNHQLPIISILERVELLDELKLVTFYADEVIELGTADLLQRSFDKQEVKLKKSKQKMQDRKMKLADAQANHDMAKGKIQSAHRTLDSLGGIVDSLRRAHDAISARFGKVIPYLDTLSSSEIQQQYGSQVTRDYQAYKSVLQENGRGRSYRKKLQQVRNNLEESVGNASKNLRNKWKAAVSYESDMKSKLQVRSLEKQLSKTKSDMEDAEQDYATYRDDYDNGQDKLDTLRKSLENQYQVEGAGFKKPRLLAVVPAQVSTFIDLKKVQYELVDDSSYVIRVDSIYTGEVDVLLNEATHYDTQMGRGGSSDREGAYQVVFEQIKMNIPRINKNIKKKAMGFDIMDRSCAQVNHYFQRLVGRTGLKIKVVTPNCSNVQDGDKR